MTCGKCDDDSGLEGEILKHKIINSLETIGAGAFSILSAVGAIKGANALVYGLYAHNKAAAIYTGGVKFVVGMSIAVYFADMFHDKLFADSNYKQTTKK